MTVGSSSSALLTHGIRRSGDQLVVGSTTYDCWAIVAGRPHRREFGDFVRRWALSRSGDSRALLVSGPSDRPVDEFLSAARIDWIQVPEWFSATRATPQISWSSPLSSPPKLADEGLPNADVQAFGRPLLEQDMELLLFDHPERLDQVANEAMRLHPMGRQFRMAGARLDLMTIDRDERTCIIECKRGGLHGTYLGQMMEYFRPTDPVVGNARLILLVNSSNPVYDEPLARLGIEIRRFPMESLVSGIIAVGAPRAARRGTQLHNSQASEEVPRDGWTRRIVDVLAEVLPQRTFAELSFKTGYVNPKKIGVLRQRDDARIFYLASNQDRLEAATPVLHELLSRGELVPFRPTRAHTVYFNMLPHVTVPLVTIDVRSDMATEWLRKHGEAIKSAIAHFDEYLGAAADQQLLQHLGAVFQSHNALKSQADGKCRNGTDCLYCRASLTQ